MNPEPRAISACLRPEPAPASRPGWRRVWSRPLPLQDSPATRFLCRSIISLVGRRVVEIRGLEHVAADVDPFIFVANHSQRLEAVLLPTLLIYHRDGKLIHFMADWPTMLVPVAGLLLRRAEVITVTRKNARWHWLNRFKPLFEHAEPAFERALSKLRAGASVGIFPEGTMNRHPERLLRGHAGAARLALRAGVPVVPAGIRFPGQEPARPIADLTPMAIEIGPPMRPPGVPSREPTRNDVQEFHSRVMREIARLSGKRWNPRVQRRRSHVPDRSTQSK